MKGIIEKSPEGAEVAPLLSTRILYKAFAAILLEKKANRDVSSADIINAAILEYCLSMALVRAGHYPTHLDKKNGSLARLYHSIL